MQGILRSLWAHIGKKVMLLIAGGRKPTPAIATLRRTGDVILAEYRQYSMDGAVSAQRSMLVTPRLIHTGDMEVVFFDDGV